MARAGKAGYKAITSLIENSEELGPEEEAESEEAVPLGVPLRTVPVCVVLVVFH